MADDPTEDPTFIWAKRLSIGLSAFGGYAFGRFLADVTPDFGFYDEKEEKKKLQEWYNEMERRERKRQNRRENERQIKIGARGRSDEVDKD